MAAEFDSFFGELVFLGARINYNLCFLSASKPNLRCPKCSSSELEYTRISSKYTKTNLSMYGRRIWFINVWNVAGALVNPKGITENSYFPYLVLKAVFLTSLPATRTCQ